jgi:SAM-dependent methyltransferase
MKITWTSRNWLVHKIHKSAIKVSIQRYARGILLDIGCGQKPYIHLTNDRVKEHIGLDHLETIHNTTFVDLFSTVYQSGLADQSVDTILCTVVLEHLERPLEALNEMFRILRPGGNIILTTPLFWHLHEEPRDFYRYTKHGLEYLFSNTGFQIIEIKPLSGFIVTFSQELIYFLRLLFRGFLRHLLIPIQTIIQSVALLLNRWDRSYGFTWAYLVVAKKPEDI